MKGLVDEAKSTDLLRKVFHTNGRRLVVVHVQTLKGNVQWVVAVDHWGALASVIDRFTTRDEFLRRIGHCGFAYGRWPV